jgi:A/G-specific adenine glycosylase
MHKQLPFAEQLLRWFDTHGRHDLPWQNPRTPYRVWLSEIMLQQTQVRTAIVYFERFLQRFPDLRSLAEAPADAVMAFWAGLGYYARARNLHACAKQVQTQYDGQFPSDVHKLAALPGIGPSTAGAISAQAFGKRAAILDANVKRVLARQLALKEDLASSAVQKHLWAHAQSLLPHTRMPDYTQALMDLGATVCTARSPRCEACPVQMHCLAFARELTADIPVRATKAARPQRSVCWLLAYDKDQRLLLQRRPNTGIWGGLYALPEFSEGELAACLAQHDLQACGNPKQLPELRHVFTHFTLIATPWQVQVQSAPSAREPALLWTPHAELAVLGLPAPIKTLLAGLR